LDHRHDELVDGNTTSDQWFFNSLLGAPRQPLAQLPTSFSAMQYRYPLPESLVAQAVGFAEFANGAAQCHAKLKNGSVHAGVLVSNATAIIAMRGHTSLPFEVSEIVSLFQTQEDESQNAKARWEFFDEWRA
jgi:hypothetical protein